MRTIQTTLMVSIFFVTGLACSNNDNLKSNASENDTISNRKIANYFPFKISVIDGQFLISASIENDELYPKYANFFEKFGYTGNGPCWEGHIIQILEKKNPELLHHINFDPEAGNFFANADSEANQVKFVEILSPIFADLSKLEEYVKSADHSRIDD